MEPLKFEPKLAQIRTYLRKSGIGKKDAGKGKILSFCELISNGPSLLEGASHLSSMHSFTSCCLCHNKGWIIMSNWICTLLYLLLDWKTNTNWVCQCCLIIDGCFFESGRSKMFPILMHLFDLMKHKCMQLDSRELETFAKHVHALKFDRLFQSNKCPTAVRRSTAETDDTQSCAN